MNALKKWFMLFGLKRMSAVPVYEICDKMRPYLKLYRLRLTETEIRFPETMSLNQFYEMRGNWSRQYDKGIPYGDIIYLEQSLNEVSLFLRSGHVFTFNSEHPRWHVTNAYRTQKSDLWKE